MNGKQRSVVRRQVLRSGIGLAAGGAAFLLACGGGTKEAAKATTTSGGGGGSTTVGAQGTVVGASTATAKRGGRLSQLNATSTNSYNVVANFAEGYTLSGVHIYDRLISTRPSKDSAKEYVLEAAASVEQPDPTTVIFKLRPGLKYQDRAPVSGRAVAAEDIVKVQEYVRDNPRAENNTFQKNSLASVTASDPTTITFKLQAPNAYLFSAAQLANSGAQCIIPKELLDNLDTNIPIGSGPYQMAEQELNVRYLYKRNPTFRDVVKNRPYIEEREWRIIADPATQEAAFRSEQVQLWMIPLPNIADGVKKDLGAKVEVLDYLALSMVTFSANVNKAPFNDIRVREALYRIINRKQYLDLLDSGRGKVPPGYLSVGYTDYQLTEAQTEKYFKQDARQSKQLLDAAGFDFNREIEMSTINIPRNNQGMEIFQQQAAQVGMKVKTLPMPFAEWLQQKIQSGNWETWYAQHPSYDIPQVPLRLQHTKTGNVHAWNGLRDPAVDAMIDKSEVTIDKAERVKLIKDIQLALLEKYTPFINTHNYTAYIGIWKYLKDYELNPATQPMYRTEMWIDK